MIKRRNLLTLAAAGASAWMVPLAARAQAAFSGKPIRIIVGVPPGGNLDVNTRAVAERMAATLGQPVLVEYKPSGSALVATRFVAAAEPDGHTLLSMSNTFVTAPATLKAAGYDPVKDFAALGSFARLPMVLSVNPSSPIRTVQELIAAARARPGQIASGTGGEGSAGDIATTLLNVQANINIQKVPYKGGSAPAITDLIGGHLGMLFDALASTAPQVEGGRLRALGVTSLERSPRLPNVPTLAESGLPGFQYEVFNGLMAPAGTPPAVMARLADALGKALASAELREAFTKNGITVPADETPARFQAFVNGEVSRYRTLVAQGHLKGE